jgi:hypothetical protein
MPSFAERIRRLRADMALARQVEHGLQTLQAVCEDRAREASVRLEGVEQRQADAQVQIAFLATELERLNGLYEAAVNRVHQLEMGGCGS